MTTQVAKWGHSLAVRIPKPVAESARLREGDPLTLEVDKNRTIVIRPVRRKYSLDQLVSGITPKNRYGETEWGPRAGKEVGKSRPYVPATRKVASGVSNELISSPHVMSER